VDPAPVWWDWDFELDAGGHVLDRMLERGFNETDLWSMIEDADDWQHDHVPGRFVLLTEFGGDVWEVIVQPDEAAHNVTVVTAYKVEQA
jgi:hypothetical protein